jgi:hypothetical protein
MQRAPARQGTGLCGPAALSPNTRRATRLIVSPWPRIENTTTQ